MKIKITKLYGGIRVYGNLASTHILTITWEGVRLCYTINREVGLTLDRTGDDKIEVEE